MDDQEREHLRKNIARLRAKQAATKGMLTRLDPQKDEQQAQRLINEIAGLEGEIASEEQALKRR